MQPLDLNQIEMDLLAQVLKRCLADLDHEIAHTSHNKFKQMLRDRHRLPLIRCIFRANGPSPYQPGLSGRVPAPTETPRANGPQDESDGGR